MTEREEVGGPVAKMERLGVLKIEGCCVEVLGSDSTTTTAVGADRRVDLWRKLAPAAKVSATAGEGEFLEDEVIGKAHVGS